MRSLRHFVLPAGTAIFCCANTHAQSQSYPVKPIRLIVPYPPGGSADLIGRAVNDHLAKRLGQPVIVDNRGGAASMIGAELTARAPADGYTLLVATVTTLAVNPAIYRKLPYEVERDFAPVSMLGVSPYLLALHPGVPARSVAQLVAHARANPGKLNFGSAGVGSGGHLASELFKHLAGIDIVHVPYKGVGAATMDVLGGQIALQLASVSIVKPHVDSGRLRGLAVSTARRTAIAPDIPTIDESGIKGYQANSWNSLVLPRLTPEPIVRRLNTEITAVLKLPQLMEPLKSQGIESEPGSPDELARYAREEMIRFRNLINAIGLKQE